MSTKKISIGTKPTTRTPTPTADDWVANDSKVMKRLTIDLPESLHKAIKMQSAQRGVTIADELRELLLQKYGNK